MQVLGLILVGAIQLVGSSITIGMNNGGNCLPVGCAGQFLLSEYQEAYASSQFSPAFQINTISFRFSASVSANNVDPATFQISFSTTSAAVGALSTNLSSNIGSNVAVFGTFVLPTTAPVLLTFTGTPYTYNPASGNLLMDIVLSGVVSNQSGNDNTFYQSDHRGMVLSRAFNVGGTTYADPDGLVTAFNADLTPEPTSRSLFGLACLL